ncbi:MAG: GNAT family N-acetyltransferase, partial [Thermoanaerobaculia bacterium]|nr:GNAT family N-acetyltransferase [Thermoanaerobaculia bacterium]
AQPVICLPIYTAPMNYREGRPGDAESIVEFQVAMARETEDMELDRSVCREGVGAVFSDPALGRYFVGEDDGRIIASLMITYEWSDWRAGTVWWIQSVYVVPDLRGRGVYRGLYEHVKSIAQEDDAVSGIRLYVDRRNENAQEVYTRLGMDGEHYVVFEWMKEF